MNKIIGNKKILLPNRVDMEKWSVVACDQFTSQPEYWKKLENFVGDAPSTLRLTLPEVYLGGDVEKRISAINDTMKRYLAEGIFTEYDGFVLVEREVEYGKKRIGLVLSVDLEAYDWNRVLTPIRATEDTILDRLPPRVAIRRNAELELPHILLLIDDANKSIIEPIYAKRSELKKLYDFELSMGGGHVTGYAVPYSDALVNGFYSLLNAETQIKKYGKDANLLFAVGDGNHSLAVAKTLWNEIKSTLTEEEKQTHPARYALVEVNNLYDDALLLEPIHRVLFGATDFVEGLRAALNGSGRLKLITRSGETYISCPQKASETVKAVQSFVESYLKTHADASVDYVHGEQHLMSVLTEKDGIGIIMPVFAKEELFDYVVNVGNLPKKAFSIGGAEFKKYYLECKKIK